MEAMPVRDYDTAKLVEQVRAGPRYGSVIPELVATVGARELERRRDGKEAVKATKSRLHQVLGAFLNQAVDYEAWSERFRNAAGDPTQFRSACAELMRLHSSTRERLPILDDFYRVILQGLPAPTTVLDLACGLHPLGLPWMGLPSGVRYVACDALTDLMGFLQVFLDLAGVDGRALCCDVTRYIPGEPVDLAFVLKSVPSMERLDKNAGGALLDTINARCVLVSFPVHSLGGRSKGMSQNYERHLWQLVEHRPWKVQRFEFPSELVFRLMRCGAQAVAR
jgi:16S rRNA (guanine(1405)-N(7))-methyltransferase